MSQKIIYFSSSTCSERKSGTLKWECCHINKFSTLAAIDVGIMTSQLQKNPTWQHSDSVGSYHTWHVSSCSCCIYVHPTMVDPASLIIINLWILSSCGASITLQDHQGRLKLGQNLAHYQLLKYWLWFSEELMVVKLREIWPLSNGELRFIHIE